MSVSQRDLEKAKEIAIWMTGGVIEFQGTSEEVIGAWQNVIAVSLSTAKQEQRESIAKSFENNPNVTLGGKYIAEAIRRNVT